MWWLFASSCCQIAPGSWQSSKTLPRCQPSRVGRRSAAAHAIGQPCGEGLDAGCFLHSMLQSERPTDRQPQPPARWTPRAAPPVPGRTPRPSADPLPARRTHPAAPHRAPQLKTGNPSGKETRAGGLPAPSARDLLPAVPAAGSPMHPTGSSPAGAPTTPLSPSCRPPPCQV